MDATTLYAAGAQDATARAPLSQVQADFAAIIRKNYPADSAEAILASCGAPAPADLQSAQAAYDAYRAHLGGAPTAKTPKKARDTYNGLARAVAVALDANPPTSGADWPSIAHRMQMTWDAFGCASIACYDTMAIGRKTTPEEDAVYQAANSLVDAAKDAVFAYTPKSLSELAEMAHLLASDTFDPHGDRVAEALAEAARAMGAADQERREAFNEVLARYELALSAQNAESDRMDAIDDAVKAEAPVPSELTIDGPASHFHSEEQIKKAGYLDFDQKAELIEIFRGWRDQVRLACARHGVTEDYPDEHEKVSTALDDVRWEAMTDLCQQTAPDLEGVALQLRSLINRVHSDFTGDHADNSVTITRLITPAETCMDDGRGIALIYQSVLVAAGLHTPAVDAQPFEPECWVTRFERTPGYLMTPRGPMYSEEHGPRVTKTHPPIDWTADWRGLAEWQRKIVLKWAGQREAAQGEAVTTQSQAA